MSRTPREPLSNEEAALAARLPILHGRAEPGAMLDARILAAAHAAVTSHRGPGLRIRRIAPLAVAASLSLAVGLAWRLRPHVAPIPDVPSAAVMMQPLPESRMMEPSNDVRDPPLPPALPPAVRPQAATRPAADARAPADQAQATALPASPPAPPPPPEAPSAATSTTDMATTPAVAAPPSAPMAKSLATDGARERAASIVAAQGTQANEAERAAAASSGEPMAHDDGFGEDVPPATVDSPEVRRAWLLRIGELLQQGRVEDAKASLAEFRRRYPDAPLPPDLRALEP